MKTKFFFIQLYERTLIMIKEIFALKTQKKHMRDKQ